MNAIEIKPIGYVKNSAKQGTDSQWGNIESEIVLNDEFNEDAFDGIEKFSHLEILYVFDKVKEEDIYTGSRHPRDNKDLPKTGIFAQRGKDRPNRIGATIVELVSHQGKKLVVKNLDAIDGTPVIDIKPVMKDFLPSGEVKEPDWTGVVMKGYWG